MAKSADHRGASPTLRLPPRQQEQRTSRNKSTIPTACLQGRHRIPYSALPPNPPPKILKQELHRALLYLHGSLSSRLRPSSCNRGWEFLILPCSAGEC